MSLKALASAALTYGESGATRDAVLPAGYGQTHRDISIGHGEAAFESATEALFNWHMHRAAGLTVAASTARAAPGVVAILRAGRRPLSIRMPCRVVYTVDEVNCKGFAYGTLPGHPERGEEAFTIHLHENEDVRVGIRAFSRPTSVLARAGGPMTRMVQEHVTDRYVNALRRYAAGS
jgi:uncharacterized protein (UPF0548 family)